MHPARKFEHQSFEKFQLFHTDVKCKCHRPSPAESSFKKTPQDEDLQVQDALASAVAPQSCPVSLPPKHTSTQQFKSTSTFPATVSTMSSSRQLPSLAAFAPRQRPVASSVWNSKIPHIPGEITLSLTLTTETHDIKWWWRMANVCVSLERVGLAALSGLKRRHESMGHWHLRSIWHRFCLSYRIVASFAFSSRWTRATSRAHTLRQLPKWNTKNRDIWWHLVHDTKMLWEKGIISQTI